MVNRAFRCACCLGGLLLFALLNDLLGQRSPVVGLDHIPVAVSDLEQASATYRALGFAIKPGRDHANGIRNAHVKFRDGSGIELITVDSAVDELTMQYVEFLAHGEGPAFLALHARETNRLIAALRVGGYEFRRDGDVIDLRQPELAYLFFVRDNRSPTDRPEHFAHRNGATALRAVWIATESGAELERLLVHLGGSSARRTVLAPDSVVATVVTVDQGEVVILPVSHQVAAGRPIIGASFRVSDVELVTRQLSAAGTAVRFEKGAAHRIVVPPCATHGIWLEFRSW